MFNDITLTRRDATGKVIQEILVPIDYAAKQKIIRRINEAKDLTQNVATTLPRISYEITGIRRDPGRQLVPIVKNAHLKENQKKTINSNYVFVPYTMNFNLYVYVKNTDDGFQICEQIIPFFTPDWAIKISSIPDMNYSDNIIIKLEDSSFTDNYEGAIDSRRMIIWTFSFSMQCRFYGPIKKTGLIKRAVVDLIIPEGKINPATIRSANTFPIEVLTVTPGMTANGEPTTDPLNTISYFDINANDDWAYIEKWENVPEGKVVYTGSDKPVSTGHNVISPSPSLLSDQNYLPQLVQTINTDSSDINIDINDGGYVILMLNNDVNSLTFNNWPEGMVGKVTLEIRNQGNYSITNYTNIKWMGGTIPDNTQGAGKKDILVIHSGDAGINIYGNIIGLNYSI